MASTTFHPCPAPECERGIVTTMEPKLVGTRKLANGERDIVRNPHVLVPMGATCPTCNGRGRVSSDSDSTCASAQVDQPITYLGQPGDAPGFEQDQFNRAMVRAFCDDLQIRPNHQDGRAFVGYRDLYGYLVTRERCTCKAGTAGMPCKHRAFLITCLDIRAPDIQRQWEAVNRERSARAQTAA